MRREGVAAEVQKKFDFSPPRPRPFVANLPAQIDGYESGVARFFQWRTRLDYYATVDQIVDFVIHTGRGKVVDLQTDTGAFALRLAGRKAFAGRVYSFDSNVTLLERARQRARHMHVESSVEFGPCDGARVPLQDRFAEVAVSIFDFHRHEPEQFLSEAVRILAPDGHLLLAEVLEPDDGPRLGAVWRRLRLKYLEKKRDEADGSYFRREDMIQLLFRAGFRQVVVQELNAPERRGDGVFGLVAATK